jgi:hypothetical protein
MSHTLMGHRNVAAQRASQELWLACGRGRPSGNGERPLLRHQRVDTRAAPTEAGGPFRELTAQGRSRPLALFTLPVGQADTAVVIRVEVEAAQVDEPGDGVTAAR